MAPPRSRSRWPLAVLLFVLTFFTTTAMSPLLLRWSRTDAQVDRADAELPLLSGSVLRHLVHDPNWLRQGLKFSLAALTILLAHELGHYLACRRYGLSVTPPFFLPLPTMFGTLGAFIRIRSPLADKRQLFDIGVAGPLAGFVTLIPFLLFGIAHSDRASLRLDPGESLLVPGHCLALELATRLYYGPLPPGTTLNLHPFALAAWFGLLVTAINLIPLGQLDGGHILYAVSPRWQRRLALPVWAALAALGWSAWPGWILWCAVTLLMGLKHPRVQDETVALDRQRRLLATAALAVLVLAFIPRGLDERTGVAAAAPPIQSRTQRTART